MSRSHNNNGYTSPSSIMRNYPVVPSHHHQRRSNSLNGVGTTTTTTSVNSDESLDLFSRTRRTVPLTNSEHLSQVSSKLGKLSVGSVKLAAKNGLDDLLAFADGGKNDYDWLLTPPETPLSTERSEFQSNLAAPRKSTVSRSTSATKLSRLSTSQTESNYSSRPARSSSVTRSSVSSVLNNGYSSNRSSSFLNTSSASVSSYIRPSSPVTRSSSTASRPSTPSRTISSRSSTPSRSRSASIVSSTDRSRSSQSSRPSTPSSRPQAPANTSFPATRSNSRPTTPTRRNTVTSSVTLNSSVSTGRGLSNGRSQTSTSRPSSPSPRVRPQHPVVPPDFPLDTPPNLRTSLSDRPVSAGRSRPGAAVTSKVAMESTTAGNLARRPASPVKSRGRSVEAHGRGHLHSNGYNGDATEPRKSTYVSDAMRKSVKPLTTTENGGFGRTISKKSLDMAIRHMDVRSGSGSMRPLPNTSLFPQSIRSGPSRIQNGHGSGSPTSIQSNGSPSFSNNGSILENGSYANSSLETVKKVENDRFYGRLSEVDMYESTRYDAILLKEDLKNTTWLHSMDDKSDQISIFDNGSESLPEPFGL